MQVLVNSASSLGSFAFKWERFNAEVNFLSIGMNPRSSNMLLVEKVQSIVDKALNKYKEYRETMKPLFDRVAKAYLHDQGVSPEFYKF